MVTDMDQAGREIPFEKKTEITLKTPVSIFRSIVPFAMRALARKQGELTGSAVHEVAFSMKGVTFDQGRLELYRKVCGYTQGGKHLPITCLESLFVGPLARLITCKDFPLSPAALIHTGQTIIQYRQIPPETALDLHCRTSCLVQTEKGIVLDVLLEVFSRKELLWQGTATLLSRAKTSVASRSGEKKSRVDYALQKQETIRVHKDTGRRYARASGDYNPHHLYAFTARALRYSRPIAHGMWSLARCMASIERDINLSMPCTVKAAFKLPVLMPAAVHLNYGRDADGKVLSFNLIDSKSGAPHVIGQLQMPD